MIQFKLISTGIYPQQRKKWLPYSCKDLPNIFSLKNIKYGMFSKSVIKRLQNVKKHGTKITLRQGRRYFLGIQVINKISEKAQNKNIQSLKKRHKKLLNEKLIQEFLDIRLKLYNNTFDINYKNK